MKKNANHKIKPVCSDCPYYFPTENYNNCSPAFSLRHARKKYNLQDCSRDEKLAFVDQIINLSQLKWIQIIQAHKHGLGSETISKDAIKGDVIPTDIVERDTTLIALRFDGKKAMVGFRDKDVFHILWFDRDFTLYKH